MNPRNRVLVCIVAGLALVSNAIHGDTYRGIPVAPEHRCAPYDRSDYPYSQSVEQRIVASLGAIYGPYTGTCFASTGETDIEHMIATSEAHDSGLCAASRRRAAKVELASLASVKIRRHPKVKADFNPHAPTWEPYAEKPRTAAMSDKLGYRSQVLSLYRRQEGNCARRAHHLGEWVARPPHRLTQQWGSDALENRVLVHPNCHAQIHSQR